MKMSPARSKSPTCHLVLTNFQVAGLAVELAADAIGRRRRPGNAEQRIDLGEVGAGQGQLDIGAGPLEGILHRSLGGDLGPAIGDVEIDRVGLAGVAQHQRRSADEMHLERLLLELALEQELGLRLAAGLARRRRDRAVEGELALGVLVLDLALGDPQMADQRRLPAILRCGRLGDRSGDRRFAQAPVELLLLADLDTHLGTAQHQRRQHDVALEQRPQANVEVDLLDLQHGRKLAPVGIGDFHAGQVDVGRRAPVDPDLVDLGLAPGVGAGLAFYALAEVAGCQEEVAGRDRAADQQHDHAQRPGSNLGDPLPGHSGRTVNEAAGSRHLDR